MPLAILSITSTIKKAFPLTTPWSSDVISLYPWLRRQSPTTIRLEDQTNDGWMEIQACCNLTHLFGGLRHRMELVRFASLRQALLVAYSSCILFLVASDRVYIPPLSLTNIPVPWALGYFLNCCGNGTYPGMVQSSHVPLAVSAVHFLQPALGFAHRVWDALRSEEYQGDESD